MFKVDSPKNARISAEYVLMDVEGTTTDINFVKNILFPYSAESLKPFLLAHHHEVEIQNELNKLDVEGLDEAILLLQSWIKEDVKHPVLKILQGYIWQQGYERKAFLAHVYSDVKPAFEKWVATGLGLGIYSSGSIAAQKLLFSHTICGSLLHFLRDHFDLSTGGKRETASYSKIAVSLNLSPQKILFLSDIGEELDAAKKSGFQVMQLVRPGTNPDPKHLQVENFLQIPI